MQRKHTAQEMVMNILMLQGKVNEQSKEKVLQQRGNSFAELVSESRA